MKGLKFEEKHVFFRSVGPVGNRTEDSQQR